MRIPFIGPASKGRSPNVSVQKTINLYPEIIEHGGKNNIILQCTPGLELFVSPSASATRGLHELGDCLYTVAGNKFYSVLTNGIVEEKGTLNTIDGRVSMADNGNEICIVDGEDGWIFDRVADTFTQIVAAGFPAANTVTFLDGYFIVNKEDTALI